ncbi:cation transporter [Modicisalibacter tunisiensis]|uniref:Cation transporter n=1 Tax=Modicisalibacter tunisiensis TaxID=390637 RepID=A0ABS7WWY1_9GAMM|nr:cation transporter [Modicisalibacter tunisiensis]MBZ9567115.1 cation transporter [Modicisalibacter tunisiensis]
MSDKERRLGVSEANLVTRKLRLRACSESALQAAIGEIDALFGLESVTYLPRKRRLDVAYDATRLCLDHIRTILSRHAITVSNGWWERVRENHYRFVDQNIKDNASQEPWSCH